MRPEIRFYVNYAKWNKEQNLEADGQEVGLFGGTFGPSATRGVTFGTYVETWF